MSLDTESQRNIPMITDVWAHNINDSLKAITVVINQGYTHVAIDTEFPGLIHRQKLVDKTIASQYAFIKNNVDKLKPIQVGLSFTNEKGERPENCSTWQFNINFDYQKDPYQPESLQLLADAQIQFDKLATDGIDIKDLSDGLLLCGLAVNPKITWLSFHGSFDFAYFIKILSGEKLPNTVQQFNELRKHLCPTIYDIKMFIQSSDKFKKYSLARLAEAFDININGCLHQAGTDAYMTADLYFKVKSNLLGDKIAKYENKIFGLSKIFSTGSAEYESPKERKNSEKLLKFDSMPDLKLVSPLKAYNRLDTGNIHGAYMGRYIVPTYMNYGAYLSYANFNMGYVLVNKN